MSITSGSVSSLSRPKKQRAPRGSKMKLGSGEPNMSNLSSYPVNHQAILRIAKSFFVIESFAAGLFWPHQRSRLKAAYDEKALEALSQGNAMATVGGSCVLYTKRLNPECITGAGIQLTLDNRMSQMVFFSSFYLHVYTIADLSNPYLDFQCFVIA